MKATVLPYQSLLDVAVSATGDAETAYDMAMQNGITLSAEPEHGTILEAPVPVKRNVAEYFRNNAQPATAITPDVAIMDGISYMAINGDFIVGKI
jgi:hypothetical protein